MSCIIAENMNLGYACICNCLRQQKPTVFSSRTLRLATLKAKGVEYVKSLAIQNLNDLLVMLRWNIEHEIFFMRLSSEIFPFACYQGYEYSLDFADKLLIKIGNYAKDNKIRLTMHPAQFNVLSSSDDRIINNSILDLNHHCDVLDRMKLDQNSVMIIHGGGVYNDKKASIERLIVNIQKLPKCTRDRLVLENCEMSYCIEDLLPISELLSVPIVIDLHHDDIYNSSNPVEFYFDRVFKVWNDRNIKPKVHVSNSIPGVLESDNKTKRRKHSDYIYFFHEALYKITFPIDIMLECKMKEGAILKLREQQI
jgi:UV DNA damage endonuclease